MIRLVVFVVVFCDVFSDTVLASILYGCWMDFGSFVGKIFGHDARWKSSIAFLGNASSVGTQYATIKSEPFC